MSAPTLTADTTGNPWVEVFFDPDDLDPDCAALRIYRQSEDRTWLVRGGVDIAPGVAALDFECPFNVTASYRAEQFTVGGGSLGFTAAASIVLEAEGTWVHNPLVPTGGILVELDSESAPEISRPNPRELITTEGSGIPRRIGIRRRGVESVPVVINVDGLENIAAWEAILGTYDQQQIAVVCIRTSDPVMWPGTFFAESEDWVKRDKTIRYGGDWVQVRAACTEVLPPHPGLVMPLLTYDDLDVAYATYTARDAAYATYTEQDRDYSLAGLAS